MWRQKKSEVVYRLLTLRAAAQEFGLHTKLIYAAVERGEVHPVKPGNRTLYPEWELAGLAVKHGYHRPCYGQPGIHEAVA